VSETVRDRRGMQEQCHNRCTFQGGSKGAGQQMWGTSITPLPDQGY